MPAYMASAQPDSSNDYQRDGFCLSPPLLSADVIERAALGMDSVMAGRFATGIEPRWAWRPGDDPHCLRKIDQAHLADPAIAEVASHPAIGRWVAAVTGARRVQLWAMQMLFKPPGGAAEGTVGMHQDRTYWKYWSESSDVFTAWVALSDVTSESGPMRFVVGSHRWGHIDFNGFFDHGALSVDKIPGLGHRHQWREQAALLPPGAISVHHRLTFHGSGPNTASLPRRALALHLRSEHSWVEPGATDYYVSHLDDQRICPVLYER